MAYKLHPEFYRELRLIDPYLKAVFDEKQVAIVIWSERPFRPKVHEYTQPLHFLNENGLEIRLSVWELEKYTLRMLRESDVWTKYGTGKAFDDALYEKQVKAEETKKAAFKKERLELLKEDRQHWIAALWNAANGRFTKKEALPYNTPTEFMNKEVTEKIDFSEKTAEPKEKKNVTAQHAK